MLEKEESIGFERIIEILQCLEEDNPNNDFNIEYSSDGRIINITFLKEVLDDD